MKNEKPYYWWLKELIGWIIAAIAISGFLLMLAGCANIKPERDSQGNVIGVTATKIGADLAYKITVEYDATGKIVLKRTEEYETRTNMDRIIDSTTKLTGQLVEGASKLP